MSGIEIKKPDGASLIRPTFVDLCVVFVGRASAAPPGDGGLTFQLILAIFTLALQHPARVFPWQGADGVELLQFILA